MVSQPDAVHAIGLMAALSIGLALKHCVADFVLQTNQVARGKEQRHGWVTPLTIHAGIHAVMTLAFAMAISPRLWWLALADFAIHFVIDRLKTLVSLWGRWQTGDEKFWWLIGADQFLHQATNVGLAAAFLLL